MAYDAKAELEKVKQYYSNDTLQKRYSALVTGETNTGKSYLLRTSRMPAHVDSFDPGGTKALKADPTWPKDDPRRVTSLNEESNPQGQIFADTFFEEEDPYKPKAYAEWSKRQEIRLSINYFDQFGTYCIDSLTTFSDAVMNNQLNSRQQAGETPKYNIDYTPQKNKIENQIRRIMNLSCDFILTGHLERITKLRGIDKKGIRDEEVIYRLMITGKAVLTIPLLFDELYVIRGSGTNPRREMLIDSLGEYIARSRFKGSSNIGAVVQPNIKEFLKKVGLEWQDKDKI